MAYYNNNNQQSFTGYGQPPSFAQRRGSRGGPQGRSFNNNNNRQQNFQPEFQNFQPQMQQNFKRNNNRSASNRARDQARGEARRERNSTIVEQEIVAKAKESLFQGMSEKELSERMAQATSVKPLPLGVTTRGVGFGTQVMYVTQKYRSSIELPDINALYRAFLGILEAKIVDSNYGEVIEDDLDVERNSLNHDFIVQAKAVVKLPEPINRIISSIGQITTTEESFLPCLPRDILDNQNRFVPTPELVRLSNLRSVVDSLSNANTPAEYRQNFRRKNPIPGTRWNDNSVLLNPDEIIPQNYTIEDFRNDTMLITPLVNQLENYIPKLKGGTNFIMPRFVPLHSVMRIHCL